MFDPAQEFRKAISRDGFQDGAKYIEAVTQDARNTIPAGAQFTFASWTEGRKRVCGWVYVPQGSQPISRTDDQKMFDPMKPVDATGARSLKV